MTIREAGEELLSYSHDVIGPNLRAVTHYNRNKHDPIFTREDIPDQIGLDEDARSMFRHPLVRMQNAAKELSSHHPNLDSPDVAIHSFGTVMMLQFPITDENGIILTLDWEGDLPEGYVSNCKSIVSGSA